MLEDNERLNRVLEDYYQGVLNESDQEKLFRYLLKKPEALKYFYEEALLRAEISEWANEQLEFDDIQVSINNVLQEPEQKVKKLSINLWTGVAAVLILGLSIWIFIVLTQPEIRNSQPNQESPHVEIVKEDEDVDDSVSPEPDKVKIDVVKTPTEKSKASEKTGVPFIQEPDNEKTDIVITPEEKANDLSQNKAILLQGHEKKENNIKQEVIVSAPDENDKNIDSVPIEPSKPDEEKVVENPAVKLNVLNKARGIVENRNAERKQQELARQKVLDKYKKMWEEKNKRARENQKIQQKSNLANTQIIGKVISIKGNVHMKKAGSNASEAYIKKGQVIHAEFSLQTYGESECTIELLDKSRVHMYENTEIRRILDLQKMNIKKGYGKYVDMATGVCDFDVKKQKRNAKFLVSTDYTQVIVLGTKFKVHSEKDYVDVSLRKGKVIAGFKKRGRAVYLKPGYTVRIRKNRKTTVFKTK